MTQQQSSARNSRSVWLIPLVVGCTTVAACSAKRVQESSDATNSLLTGAPPDSTGDVVATTEFSNPARCQIGTSIALLPGALLGLDAMFPTLLAVSCFTTGADRSNIQIVDPTTGGGVRTITTDVVPRAGWGALAMRGSRHDLLACEHNVDNGLPHHIYRIDIDPLNEVPDGTTTFMFDAAPGLNACDGLAWDGTDSTIWMSPDVSNTIFHYDEAGHQLAAFPAPEGCPQSGLAVGGDTLFAACNGTGTIYLLDKTNGAIQGSFATPAQRNEDLEIDPITFGGIGRTVLWSRDAFQNRALGYEIPTGSGGAFGDPAAKMPIKGTQNVNPVDSQREALLSQLTALPEPPAVRAFSLWNLLRLHTGGLLPPTASPTPEGSTTCAKSSVDNLKWSFVHEAIDYTTVLDATNTGCLRCGNCRDQTSKPGELSHLDIRRYHRPKFGFVRSSFGPGVFGWFDSKLRFRPGINSKASSIELYDAETDSPPIRFDEIDPISGDQSIDGIYHDVDDHFYNSLRLFDQQGRLTGDQRMAETAVLTDQTGTLHVFEVISTGSSDATQTLEARLTARKDRNGNADRIDYLFPHTASDGELSQDRTKLWQVARVSDAYGVAAQLSYASTKIAGRWAVSALTLPNGQRVRYTYSGQSDSPGLVAVAYPDGTTAHFSASIDQVSQDLVLRFEDNAVVGGHIRESVHLTRSAIFDSSRNLVAQVPNLVRQIVNGDSEIAYRNEEDARNPLISYVYEGGGSAIRIETDSNGDTMSYSRAARRVSASEALTSVPYQLVESYSYKASHLLSERRNTFGDAVKLERSATSRVITSAMFPDRSAARSDRNSFLQPTQVVDVLGHVGRFDYDSKGNLLRLEVAAGTRSRAEQRFSYNGRGQLMQSTDANGNATDYEYDSVGFLAAIVDAPDHAGAARPVRRFVHDAIGRLLSSEDANGRKVAYHYDTRNRITAIDYADGSQSTFEYGSGQSANQLVASADRNRNSQRYSYDATGRRTRIISAAGRPEEVSDTWEYLEGSDLVAAEIVRGDRTDFEFDGRQQLVATVQRPSKHQQLRSQMVYDAVGRRTKTVDPYGRSSFMVYDVDGRVIRTVQERVPGGVPSGIDLRSLLREPAPNSDYVIEDVAYAPGGSVVERIDPRGVKSTATFDEQSRVIEMVDAAGTSVAARSSLTYDPQGNLIKTVHPRTFTEGTEFATVSTYNGRDLLESVTDAVGRPEAATTSYAYTPTGKRAAETDPRGHTSQSRYDECCDRLSESIDQLGFITTYTYDANGNRISTTDANGNISRFSYDGLNRQIVSSNGEDEATTIEYDDDLTDGRGLDAIYRTALADLDFGPGAVGSARLTIDPLGEAKLDIRDGLGRPRRVVDPNGNRTTTRYDQVVDGLVQTSTIDPLGHIRSSREDGGKLERQTIDAEGRATRFAFDPSGNQISMRNPNDVGQDCRFDERSRRLSCTDTEGDTRSSVFDAEGNQTASIDGEGHAEVCVFDGRNRRSACADRLGGVTRVTYDGDSNIVKRVDAEGGATSYVFDPRNLSVEEHYPDGGTRAFSFDPARRLASRVDQEGAITTMEYDRANRLTARVYPDGLNDLLQYDHASRLIQANSKRYGTLVKRQYDAGSRLTEESQEVRGDAHELSYTYDAANRQTTVRYPDGSLLSRQFTDRDQLAEVEKQGLVIARRDYDLGGRLVGTTFGNGLVEKRAYRSDNLISSIESEVTSLSYAYDHNKRRTAELDALFPSEDQTLSYDREDRVVSWRRDIQETQTWQLSLVGDWNETDRDGVRETRKHNAVHEVLQVDNGRLSYDRKGNLVASNDGRHFDWDFENRLQEVKAGSDADDVPGGRKASDTAYGYDALGRRLSMTRGGVTTVFVHDGEQAIAEYADGHLSRTYVFAMDLDDPLALLIEGESLYMFQNALRTVRAVADQRGRTVERYRYQAYGERTSLDGSGRVLSEPRNPIGFTGRYHDKNDLIYFRARFYDPTLGRFISRQDNYRDGMSLYRAYFVPNGIDPTGRGPKIGIEGHLEIDIDLCGGTIKAFGKLWFGVGWEGSVFGEHFFIGVSDELHGQIGSTIKLPVHVPCGQCDPCCHVLQLGEMGPHVEQHLFLQVDDVLAPIEGALGVSCDAAVEADNCQGALSLDCHTDLIKRFLPGGAADALEALKGIGLTVEATADIQGKVGFCKGQNYPVVLNQAEIDAGFQIAIGVGLGSSGPQGVQMDVTQPFPRAAA